MARPQHHKTLRKREMISKNDKPHLNSKLYGQGSSMENSHDQKSVRDQLYVKYSKSEQPIPVINGVHLHSIYNPEREASGFVTNQVENLKASKSILIFGLGFGYHITQIEEKMKAFHPMGYKIFVIEPNLEIVEKWKELNPTSFSDHVTVVSHRTIKDFYKDTALVDFMSSRPAVIPHPASFQLNMAFFKDFMSYCYPKEIDESAFFVEAETFRNYLTSENRNETTEDFFERVRGKSFLQSYDFLSLALAELVQER